MAKVKGTALVPRLKYIEKKCTADQKSLIQSMLSPVFREQIKNGVFAGQWYPFEYYVEINRVIDKVAGKGDLSLVPQLGRFSAEESLQGIYRFFYKIGSPEFTVKIASTIWNQYFVNGKLVVEEVARRRMRFRMESVEIESPEHCLSVLGWVQKIVELTGAKILRTEITPPPLPQPIFYEFIISYE